MKVRGVVCIHFAAFAVSTFILVCLAFSYYRSSSLSGIVGTTRIGVVSSSGRLYLSQISDWPFGQQLMFEFTEPVPEDPHAYSQGIDGLETTHFAGMTFGAYALKVTGSTCLTRYLVVPQYFFLIPPMMWMGSFYLFKLRRRFRDRSGNPEHISEPELSEREMSSLLAEVPDRKAR